MEKLSKQQKLILGELNDLGNRSIATHELDTRINNRHNRWLGYDRLFASLKRLEARGLVKRESHPARWSITDKGIELLSIVWGD